MSNGIDTGGGAGVGGDVGTGGGNFTGRDDNDHRNNVNVYVYDDLPANETERRQWMVRQINELRYALLGDGKYGVDGMVDTVRKIWIWLYVLSVLLAIVTLMLLYQQFQIHQVLQRLM